MTIRNFFSILIYFSLITTFLISCGSGSNNQESNIESNSTSSNEALKEEVIAIHDEVMPKMGALRSHQKRLMEEAAELKSRDSIQYKEEIEYRKLLALELDQAYDGMFVWMRQFRPQLDDMDEEEGRTYLLDQKEKVKKVNDDIKSALDRAEENTLSDI